MANYSKRDARKAWLQGMIASGGERSANPLPRCHCGELAVIGFYPENGANHFFCEAQNIGGIMEPYGRRIALR